MNGISGEGKQTQVPLQLNEMRSLLEQVSVSMEKLEERLQPVLSARVEENFKEQVSEIEPRPLVKLAEELLTFNKSIKQLNEKISSIYNAVEL